MPGRFSRKRATRVVTGPSAGRTGSEREAGGWLHMDRSPSYPPFVETLCRDCVSRPDAVLEACPACGSSRVVRHEELHDLAIAHLDCDEFYAAVEKRDRPALRNQPVIVSGHHRGVVAACCYRARARGVHSAMPMFKTLEAYPEAAAVKPDMKKHAAVGWEVRAMMRG